MSIDTMDAVTLVEPLPLLASFKVNQDCYFSSPDYAILAKPPFARLLQAGTDGLSDRVKQSIRFAKELGHSQAIVVGAVPFDITREPQLKLTSSSFKERLSVDERNARRPQNTRVASFGASQQMMQSIPSAQAFVGSVQEALRLFATTELEKVVLSRSLRLKSDGLVNIHSLLHRLEHKNKAGYTFAIDLENEPNQRAATLVGASPELLISKRGNKIVANPLAGSEPRHNDPLRDQVLAKQLFVSEKDRREHALVIDSVAKALKPFCKVLDVPAEPSVINTATMWHLSSLIEGELIDEHCSVLDLALAMHPTPAICGFPEQEAFSAINNIEAYDRGLFTGMVGWCDELGDGDWAVTIRCAEVQGDNLTLYAGAGIVEGSCPQKELAETAAKFNTMLDALGVEH